MKAILNRALLGTAFLGFFASNANAQPFVMVVNSTTDTIVECDPVSGAVLGTFATMPVTGSGVTPKEALQVGSEVWVSDQLRDCILRFDSTGAFIDMFVGPSEGLDNVRGFEVADGKLWVTCGSGTFNGQIAVFDATTRAFLFSVSLGGSPFDCFLHNGEILVPNDTSNDIDRVSLAGEFIGKFVDSTAADAPLDFPQQLAHGANNDVLVAEFSSTSEYFRFDQAGTLLDSIDMAPASGSRGVYRLGNGKVMLSTGAGIYTHEPSEGTVLLSSGNFQYINLYTPVSACSADINGTGGVTADDIFAFLDAWFAQNGQTGPGLTADFNDSNDVTADDIFAFLDAWFAQNGACS